MVIIKRQRKSGLFELKRKLRDKCQVIRVHGFSVSYCLITEKRFAQTAACVGFSVISNDYSKSFNNFRKFSSYLLICSK